MNTPLLLDHLNPSHTNVPPPPDDIRYSEGSLWGMFSRHVLGHSVVPFYQTIEARSVRLVQAIRYKQGFEVIHALLKQFTRGTLLNFNTLRQHRYVSEFYFFQNVDPTIYFLHKGKDEDIVRYLETLSDSEIWKLLHTPCSWMGQPSSMICLCKDKKRQSVQLIFERFKNNPNELIGFFSADRADTKLCLSLQYLWPLLPMKTLLSYIDSLDQQQRTDMTTKGGLIPFLINQIVDTTGRLPKHSDITNSQGQDTAKTLLRLINTVSAADFYDSFYPEALLGVSDFRYDESFSWVLRKVVKNYDSISKDILSKLSSEQLLRMITTIRNDGITDLTWMCRAVNGVSIDALKELKNFFSNDQLALAILHPHNDTCRASKFFLNHLKFDAEEYLFSKQESLSSEEARHLLRHYLSMTDTGNAEVNERAHKVMDRLWINEEVLTYVAGDPFIGSWLARVYCSQMTRLALQQPDNPSLRPFLPPAKLFQSACKWSATLSAEDKNHFNRIAEKPLIQARVRRDLNASQKQNHLRRKLLDIPETSLSYASLHTTSLTQELKNNIASLHETHRRTFLACIERVEDLNVPLTDLPNYLRYLRPEVIKVYFKESGAEWLSRTKYANANEEGNPLAQPENMLDLLLRMQEAINCHQDSTLDKCLSEASITWLSYIQNPNRKRIPTPAEQELLNEIGQLVDTLQPLRSSEEKEPTVDAIEEAISCPILKTPIKYPALILTANRQLYEYNAIYQWVENKRSCPVTRKEINVGQIITLNQPNITYVADRNTRKQIILERHRMQSLSDVVKAYENYEKDKSEQKLKSLKNTYCAFSRGLPTQLNELCRLWELYQTAQTVRNFTHLTDKYDQVKSEFSGGLV